MRLFVGLDIDEPIRERLTQLVQRLQQRVPDVRFVHPDTFHVTLKFLGETGKVEQLKQALANVRCPQFDINFSGTGFFPGLKNPRIFWAGIHAGEELPALAAAIDAAAEPLGFEREKGPYKPHLTLSRSGSGRPHPKPGDRTNPKFERLQQVLAQHPQPEFGTMTAREFFLYESKLGPGGAKYFKIARYPLGQ